MASLLPHSASSSSRPSAFWCHGVDPSCPSESCNTSMAIAICRSGSQILGDMAPYLHPQAPLPAFPLIRHPELPLKASLPMLTPVRIGSLIANERTLAFARYRPVLCNIVGIPNS
ncbi:hypothetical protein LX36DRAFT_51434 [Colletotrichum falcatum]|nr:hypothetical protein LX36DRAFT_315668 [Colletotrichum falcatum]KAK1997985.1 hypothetical protein LX36DRAFT_51434 [Colletotrichum falcatum]